MPTDFFDTHSVVTLVDGRRLAVVVSARDVSVGDLIDGWLRVDSVRTCAVDDDLVDFGTADGFRRVANRMPCLVERAD